MEHLRVHWSIGLLVAVLSFAGLSGCESGEGEPGARTIGPNGGSVTSEDGRFTLTVPAGALTAPVRFTVTVRSATTITLPGGVGAIYDVEPSGTAFAVAATAAIRYDELSWRSGDTSDLLLITTNGAGGWVSALDQRVDVPAETALGEVFHLSGFTLVDASELLEHKCASDPDPVGDGTGCPAAVFPSVSLETRTDETMRQDYLDIADSCPGADCYPIPDCFIDLCNLVDAQTEAPLGLRVALSESFTLWELIRSEIPTQDRGRRVLVSPELVRKLQAVRDDVSKPLRINSGYRSPRHQRDLCDALEEGPCATCSRHSWGDAADVAVRYSYCLQEAAARAGFAYCLPETGRLHVDDRSSTACAGQCPQPDDRAHRFVSNPDFQCIPGQGCCREDPDATSGYEHFDCSDQCDCERICPDPFDPMSSYEACERASYLCADANGDRMTVSSCVESQPGHTGTQYCCEPASVVCATSAEVNCQFLGGVVDCFACAADHGAPHDPDACSESGVLCTTNNECCSLCCGPDGTCTQNQPNPP